MMTAEALKPVVARLSGAPTVAVVGDVYTLLATGEQTGGAFALIHAIVSPGGGPPLHLHRREEECFYVLEGAITFEMDGREIVAEVGTFVFSPRGVRHRFCNHGRTPARMLIQVTPAGFEQFAVEVGRPLSSAAAAVPPPTDEEVQLLLKIAPQYGIEIFSPG